VGALALSGFLTGLCLGRGMGAGALWFPEVMAGHTSLKGSAILQSADLLPPSLLLCGALISLA